MVAEKAEYQWANTRKRMEAAGAVVTYSPGKALEKNFWKNTSPLMFVTQWRLSFWS
jgi:hypothetical protein